MARDSGKKKSTLSKENEGLKRWIKFMGHSRIDRISLKMIHDFRSQRLKSGVKARTANLDIITLNNVFNFAKEQGHLTKFPTQEIKPLKVITPPRRPVTVVEFEKLCSAATKHCSRNGRTLSDYLRFLAYSGGREQESLRIRWDDVYFDRGYVVIGQDGQTKNSSSRIVDFNPALETHLKDMHSRRRIDSPHLFPSSRNDGVPFKDLRYGLRIARSKAGLDKIGFHDLRALFITYSVMSGVDLKTISEWVGHRSGTQLVDKVYTKLVRGHKKHQAQKVSFASH
jgi:integrase